MKVLRNLQLFMENGETSNLLCLHANLYMLMCCVLKSDS